jgi:flagellar biosynthesis protein FlhA
VRSALRASISKKIAREGNKVYVITIAPDLEQYMTQSIQKMDHTSNLVIDPNITQALYQRIAELFQKQIQLGISPVILCSPLVRMYFKRLIEKKFPEIDVVSFNEVMTEMTIENVGMLDLKKQEFAAK